MTSAILQRNMPWLLASLACVAAPHAARLPTWVLALCLVAGGWRWLTARRNSPAPGKPLVLALAATATLGIYLGYGTLFGRDAGVALLVSMLALKLLEIHNLRDGLVAIFLGYFLAVTNFLYSQTPLMGLYMLAAVLLVTATLVGLNHPGEPLPPRYRVRLAAVLLGQGLPIMLVLFVFFPRVQGPLWGLPNDAYAGMTGLSNSMSPGSISRLGRSDAVAFRVAFAGAAPEPPLRYWRGPVLWDYDGRTWTQGLPTGASAVTLQVSGAPVTYTLTLEPHNQRWLFALDFPVKLPPASRMSADYQVLANEPARQRLRYEMVSYPSYRAAGALSADARVRALQLPPGYNPQARALAESWRREARSDEAVVRQALAMFHDAPFVYTLQAPVLGIHAVDEFLFGTRRGFCEHYAGSFVFLMRAAGIPARVVTGYQGGESNPLGNYLIVRQSDAHAWVEVWLKNQGWMRFDPTAQIAPQRVEAEGGMVAALPATDALPVFARLDYGWLQQLRFSWDVLNYGWHQWVLNYHPKRQREFLSRFHEAFASPQGMAAGLAIGVGVLLLGFAAWMLLREHGVAADPVSAAYRRFCRKLARVGLSRRPNEGALDFARRIAETRPDLARQARNIIRLYVTLRYGRRPRPARLRCLRARVASFKP